MASGPPRRGDRGRGYGRGDRTRGRGRGDHSGDRSSSTEQRALELPFRPNARRRRENTSRDSAGGYSSGGDATDGIFTPNYSSAIDKNITSIENNTLSLVKQDLFDLPVRPGYGTRGKEVSLWANYFRLNLKQVDVNKYNVTVSPSQGDTPVRPKVTGRVVQLLLERLSGNRHGIATDFRTMLICRRRLEQDESTYSIPYRNEGENAPPADAKVYNVTLQYEKTLTLSSLLDTTTSTNASALIAQKPDIIQALNLIVGQHPKSDPGTLTVGKNRHVSATPAENDVIDLGAGLQGLRAFVFSCRAATERVLLNVHVKNLAFYTPGPLEALVSNFNRVNREGNFALAKFLKLLSVQVTHIRRGNEVAPNFKTIVGLATPKDGKDLRRKPTVPSFAAGPKAVKFFLKDKANPNTGRYISVFDFFRERHQITIRNVELPVVNVGTIANPSYLPMQVCEVRPGQVAKVKISPSQTAKMINFAVRKPKLNAESIVNTGLPLLGLQGGNAYFNAFETSVVPQMITVPGRVMQPPSINYKSRETTPTFGNWNLTATQFFRSRVIHKWTTLRISYRGSGYFFRDETAFQACIRGFEQTLNATGLHIERYIPGLNLAINHKDPDHEIDNALAQIHKRQPDLLLVILPQDDNTNVYNRVKQMCDIHLGLVNQCVIDSKFSKANSQYHANVGLKINLKLGGLNHYIKPDDLSRNISPNETMFVGIDVTHPSPGSAEDAPSIASVVSSIDDWLGQWPASIRVQKGREEMVQALEDLMADCLKRWKKAHKNAPPKNIIVYRDGVSEGEFARVLDTELSALQNACKTHASLPPKGTIPKLAIVMVGKRHHTRFYATKAEDADRSSNPENGTVVDRGVTDAANWDFFLQAHCAIKGTARPAHYYVLHDEIFRKQQAQYPNTNAADILEQLSHNMCYLFGRATKAVSVCPPAYYADLVCERARRYIAETFDASDTMSTGTSKTSGSQSATQSSGLTAAQAKEASEQAKAAALERRLRELQALLKVHENVRETMFYI